MGWIIAGAVVAAILILLMTSVKVRFDYADPGELRLKINWLFVTLVRIPAKPKKRKRRSKKAVKAVRTSEAEGDPVGGSGSANGESNPADVADTQQGSSEKTEKPAKSTKSPKAPKPPKPPKPKSAKLTLSDILALVKLVYDSLGTPLKRLLKATRITNFRLDITVCGDDAAAAAIKFGRVNIAAGAALAFLDGCFTLKDPKFNVVCDFQSEETRTECSFTARLTLIAALAFLFWVLGRLVKNYLSRKDAAAALDKLRK